MRRTQGEGKRERERERGREESLVDGLLELSAIVHCVPSGAAISASLVGCVNLVMLGARPRKTGRANHSSRSPSSSRSSFPSSFYASTLRYIRAVYSREL